MEMNVRRRAECAAYALILAVVLWAPSVLAQNPILDFSFEMDPITVPVGGTVETGLRVANAAVQEADSIEIALLSGPVTLAAMDPIEVLAPFSDTRMSLLLTADETAPLGRAEARFEVSYTYCIGDLCFQIVDEISLQVDIVEPAPLEDGDGIAAPVVPPAGSTPTGWRFVLPVVLLAALVVTLWAARSGRRPWALRVALIAILAVALGYGISLRQAQQAQSIGAVLCTSCVGIEVTPHEDPDLSDAGRERVAALSQPIELIVFSATWCHACPYAKAMVKQVSELAPAVTYRIIDVDQDREAADRYGIVQSGRTIVPAILRVDTGALIFGIENLEERLLSMLEGS
jgi:thiol-disulfide isomerase/thioredoxin